MVPELVGKLTTLGYEVLVVPGAGEAAQYADEEYTAAGAIIADDAVASADLVVSVQPLESSVVRGLREGVSTISFLPVNQSHDLVADLRDAGVTAFAMELVPGSRAHSRWTRCRRRRWWPATARRSSRPVCCVASSRST
jgi:NAD(P) transhydrogenase subunit alpha